MFVNRGTIAMSGVAHRLPFFDKPPIFCGNTKNSRQREKKNWQTLSGIRRGCRSSY
jgi:hypothetical protein